MWEDRKALCFKSHNLILSPVVSHDSVYHVFLCRLFVFGWTVVKEPFHNVALLATVFIVLLEYSGIISANTRIHGPALGQKQLLQVDDDLFIIQHLYLHFTSFSPFLFLSLFCFCLLFRDAALELWKNSNYLLTCWMLGSRLCGWGVLPLLYLLG